MGFFSFLTGPDEAAAAMDSSPQVRLDVPGTSDPSTALVIARRDSAASSVSEGQALGLVAVYRAAQVISTAGMQCSLDAFRDGEEIAPKPSILRKPDPDEPLSAFLEKSYLSLTLNGNAFWRVFRDNQGRVTSLRVLNPHDVVIKTNSDGLVIGYLHGKSDKLLTKSDIKHLSHMRVPGNPRGIGPIQSAQIELRGAIDTRDYAAHWFTESGVPSGLLSTDKPLTEVSAAEMKAQWTQSQGGFRGVAILGNGFSYQPVYLSPEDAQFIEGQQFNTTAIARLFGIPAHLMLAAIEGSAQTYSNMTQADAGLIKYTLMRYVIEIESALSEVLPRGTEVKVNLESLLRPDVLSRYDMHEKALTNGWMTKDEIRAIEGLPPLPKGLGEAQAPVAPAPEVSEDPETPEEEPADV